MVMFKKMRFTENTQPPMHTYQLSDVETPNGVLSGKLNFFHIYLLKYTPVKFSRESCTILQLQIPYEKCAEFGVLI